MNNPLVSVVMPVYNVEKYVEKAINSVLNQTYSNFELILINDGSEDNSLEICKRFAREDSRISIIDKINGGVSKARNDGIEKASGKYVMFIDSDDIIEKNMLQNMVSSAEGKSSDLVICGLFVDTFKNQELIDSYTISEKQNIILGKYNVRKYFIKMIQNSNIYTLWNKLYKLEIIKLHKLSFNCSLDFGEDLVFNFDYIYNIENIFVDNNCYYHYIQDKDNDSLSSKYREDKIDIIKIWYNKLFWFSMDILDDETISYVRWLKFRWVMSCIISEVGTNKNYETKLNYIRRVMEEESFVLSNKKFIGIKKFCIEQILYRKNIYFIYFLAWGINFYKSKLSKIYSRSS